MGSSALIEVLYTIFFYVVTIGVGSVYRNHQFADLHGCGASVIVYLALELVHLIHSVQSLLLNLLPSIIVSPDFGPCLLPNISFLVSCLNNVFMKPVLSVQGPLL